MTVLRWVFAVPAAWFLGSIALVAAFIAIRGACRGACRMARSIGARLARDKHCPDPLLGQLREVLGDDVSDLDLPPGWDRVAVLHPRKPRSEEK